MAPVGGLLWRSARVHQIWGANTDVGKTVFSTLLCAAASHHWPDDKITFLKPVSTGPLNEADDNHIQNFFTKEVRWKYDGQYTSHCLHQFEDPVSPDIAAARSKQDTPTDASLLKSVNSFIHQNVQNPGWLFVETAGGVHSPGPSGTSQADLYRPLRAPAILVGDAKLGGISATISAFESLRIRGYDVESVLLFDGEYQNHNYLTGYFDKFGIPCRTLKHPPLRSKNPKEDAYNMLDYYQKQSKSPILREVLLALDKRQRQRIERLESMSSNAHDCIWYPFTQQKLLPPEKITAIDSASGDFFQTFDPQAASKETSPSPSLLKASFDGSASWWTQGLGHANPQLTLAAAYAAGRYGHVMFAEAVHEPALQLAELLLAESKNPRLSRVFYSDDGSTGTEVAVKMGLRAARMRYGWDAKQNLEILGLKGSYHGDTMGAMDCSEPSTYNEKIEWYKGKGFWFDYPTVKMVNKQWVVEVPEELQDVLGPTKEFTSLADVYDVEARDTDEQCRRYESFITKTLEELQAQGRKFGALMLEPVILGAGGMHFIDPLFQRTLVNVVRRSPHLFSSTPTTSTAVESSEESSSTEDERAWSGLPVIFDEVFTGLYRLGRFTSGSFLGVHPDITVHAKLLTGGLVPLCTTLASESIFRAFSSDDKSDALLHGHSYTAHAVGCAVAVESVKTMQRMESRGEWDAFKRSWVPGKYDSQESEARETAAAVEPARRAAGVEGERDRRPENEREVWSVWSQQFLWDLSALQDSIESVSALGSVLAIRVKDQQAGYTSNAARKLQAKLFEGQAVNQNWNVHSRVLGNVLYLMASQTSTKETIQTLQELVLKKQRQLSNEKE